MVFHTRTTTMLVRACLALLFIMIFMMIGIALIWHLSCTDVDLVYRYVIWHTACYVHTYLNNIHSCLEHYVSYCSRFERFLCRCQGVIMCHCRIEFNLVQGEHGNRFGLLLSINSLKFVQSSRFHQSEFDQNS